MEHLIRNIVKGLLALLLFIVVAGVQIGQAQTIRDKNNSTIARIDSDGTVRNSSNSTIAHINSNGDIRDSSNRLLGTVSSDGTVRNSNNSTIGYAKDVPVRYAAIYFFFDLI